MRNYSKILAAQAFLQSQKNNCAASASVTFLKAYIWLTYCSQSFIDYGTKQIFETNYAQHQLVNKKKKN